MQQAQATQKQSGLFKSKAAAYATTQSFANESIKGLKSKQSESVLAPNEKLDLNINMKSAYGDKFTRAANEPASQRQSNLKQ